jgi:hypothetical protein
MDPWAGRQDDQGAKASTATFDFWWQFVMIAKLPQLI